MRGAARMNDTILHGGNVIGANPTVLTNGRGTATIGSPCNCTKHGAASVITGRPDVLVGGVPIARVRDYVGCGPAAPPDIVSGPSAGTPSGSGKTYKRDAHVVKLKHDGQKGATKYGYEVTVLGAGVDAKEGKANLTYYKVTAYSEVDDGITVKRVEVEQKVAAEGELRDSAVEGLLNDDGTINLAKAAEVGVGGDVQVTMSTSVNVGGKTVTSKKTLGLGLGKSAGTKSPVKGTVNPKEGTLKLGLDGDAELGPLKVKYAREIEVSNVPKVALAGINKITSASGDVMVGD